MESLTLHRIQVVKVERIFVLNAAGHNMSQPLISNAKILVAQQSFAESEPGIQLSIAKHAKDSASKTVSYGEKSGSKILKILGGEIGIASMKISPKSSEFQNSEHSKLLMKQ